MTPTFRLLANGNDVTKNIADRLLSLKITDEAEDKSDVCTLVLDDRPVSPGEFVALPAIGTEFEVAIGYAGDPLTTVGKYKVDEITYRSPPATLEVSAKAANMPSRFRSPSSESYHDTTLGGIVERVARENGFGTQIDPALGAIRVLHEDRTAESPMAFLTRLGNTHDAVIRPVNGTIVVAPRGLAVSATGAALPGYVLRPTKTTKWEFKHSARTSAGDETGGEGEEGGGVRVVWWDERRAELREVTSGRPPYQELKFAAGGEREARAMAGGAKNGRDRKTKSFGFTMPGDALIQAEAKLTLEGFRPEIPVEWRVTSVEHVIDRRGWVTTVDCDLFSEAQTNIASTTRNADAEWMARLRQARRISEAGENNGR